MQQIIITVLVSMVIGYGFGCINVSYILSKIKGFDIRKYGSGNAGASNVVIVIGRKAGIIVALLDIFKAYVAVKICGFIFPDALLGIGNYAACVAGTFAILGHIFPFYMNFKGGKGLASLGGTILALNGRLFFILLFIAIIIAVVTDYICFVPTSMSLIFPVTYGYIEHSWAITLILLIPAAFMWYRHMENFERIRRGEEAKLHILWDRESEAERFGIIDDGEDVFNHEIKE